MGQSQKPGTVPGLTYCPKDLESRHYGSFLVNPYDFKKNKSLKHVGLWVFETVPSQKPGIPGSLADPRSLGQSGVFGNVAEARDSSKFKVDTCCRPKLASWCPILYNIYNYHICNTTMFKKSLELKIKPESDSLSLLELLELESLELSLAWPDLVAVSTWSNVHTIKGTVSVISNNLTFIEWHVRFKRYPLNFNFIKNFVDILFI